MNHPQIEARQMVRQIEYEPLVSGELKTIGPPIKFSESKTDMRVSPPLLGQHNEAILTELGYSSSQIDGLRSERVI